MLSNSEDSRMADLYFYKAKSSLKSEKSFVKFLRQTLHTMYMISICSINALDVNQTLSLHLIMVTSHCADRIHYVSITERTNISKSH